MLKTLLAWSGRHFRTLGFLENVLHALSATERMKPNIQNIFNKWISGWPHPIFIYTVESIRKAMFQEKVAIDSKVSFKRLNDSSLLTMPYSAGKSLVLNELCSFYYLKLSTDVQFSFFEIQRLVNLCFSILWNPLIWIPYQQFLKFLLSI